MRIVTVGLSEEDGVAGNIVRVKNITSNKIIYARVLSDSMVELDFRRRHEENSAWAAMMALLFGCSSTTYGTHPQEIQPQATMLPTPVVKPDTPPVRSGPGRAAGTCSSRTTRRVTSMTS